MPSPDLSFHPTPTTPPGSFSKKDRSTRKKKPSYPNPPTVPPKSSLHPLDTNLDEMDGIVDLAAFPPANPDSNSPGSGFESSHQSSSDVSSMQFGSIGASQHSVFTNPFLSGSQRRLAPGALVYDGRRISPKARPPGMVPTVGVEGDPPSWTAPESWAVEKDVDPSITAYSSSDESVQGAKVTTPPQQPRTTTKQKKKPRNPQPKGLYKVRIYRANNSYHVVSCDLNVTVAQLTPQLNKKLLLDPGVEPHRLHLKERGRERVLAPTERPADIVRRRLEQAGYDFADGLDLLGADDIQFLLKFVYKSNVLGPPEDEMQFDSFDLIDLTSRSLRAVPITLYAHADAIVSLNLSRNPMLEIPLDFIQACTTLRELRLSHMALKKVPQSVRHCRTLQRLDLSCNRMTDLDDAGLEKIPQLRHLKLQNNRMDALPKYFVGMHELRDLNISNNKFKDVPSVVCGLQSLVDLDVSFNMITVLPQQLGQLTQLEHFIIVGNQVSRIPEMFANLRSLRVLDCRRNPIVDISVVCTLPKIEQLLADHNSMHALDVSFGPSLKELDASHNDITQLTLVPGPLGLPYALTTLNLSHAKLSTLDDMALAQLTALEVLHIDHNSIRSLPESMGGLSRLKHLSCSNNHLFMLPSSIGRLQWLEKLEAHNNDLSELPMSLWNCSSLQVINVTSNVISTWSLPPGSIDLDVAVSHAWGSSSVSLLSDRKGSSSSIAGSSLPALASSLEELYVGENSLTADSLHPLALLKELEVLNLSFNSIQQLPSSFFRNLVKLRELYLSGNDISAIPTENLQHMVSLEVLFLNGNKLQTLPREISKLTKLSVMDVGSNVLKYNINNWEFDWNWNFNTNLRYLNLSGNKRLEIKPDMNHKQSRGQQQLSDFSSLTQLRILGLMDVTIGMQTNIPEESEDRRVRTSMADVNGVAYGIADTLSIRGATDQLTMIDLVQPNFRGSPDEAVFAMFGRASHVASNNKLTKFLHDSFLRVFAEELARLSRSEEIPDAMRRSFLKLNKLLHDYLYSTSGRKMSHVSASAMSQAVHDKIGASGIVLYLVDRTLYIANAGNALAVISRQGIARLVSRKHDPFDRLETARIRAAEGWVSPKGFVNDEIDVSRSFGFYYLLPVVNPRPDVYKYDLTTLDEFVIVGNRGLWDYVSYQTAVDIARKERDPMIASQKLRDFAISYGAEGTTMIMVIRVSDLFPKGLPGDPQGSPEPVIFPEELIRMVKNQKPKTGIINSAISRLIEEVPPPTGHLALVFTDIRNSTHLWEVNPGMQSAMTLHSNLLRRLLRFCGGYEVKTEGDAFMCSFPTTLSALWWCMSVQTQLLELPWPLELLECEDGKEIHKGGRLLARGLSLRMGIHCGQPVCEPDPVTGRMDYFGPMVNRAARVNAVAAGGQIMCSADVIKEINARILETGPTTDHSHHQPLDAINAIRTMGVAIFPVGEVKLKGLEVPEYLSIVYPESLQLRQDLEPFEAAPTASGSRVQFSVEQMRELGLLCVRLETLAMSKVFRPTPVRKGSIASVSATTKPEDDTKSALVVYDDPSLYLPVMDEKSTDAALTTVLHSLSLRIDNALTKLAFMYMSDIERERGAPDLALRDQILELCRPIML
ncbi:uncharacterized protein TRAVEDRAFT_161932 [Trametes versicolor FP-101664 SS1]|uniref:uncharacterized protein n=1 Tax=Trametes versicolor (strain FP-101664) TaxID=717944 RepID=UPI000462449A|nr:uncharacterized protein TRAVEDRAFT_161932 [Trametes versicolor FP-101664 SS1]EIW63579.1 hypothetical protein TRAVEDRAFT_161932 [Trametes versicolor FP-101664 SS1]